jgi:glutathione S-transferase
MYGGLDVEIPADEFPNLTHWMNTLEQRESFERSLDENARKYYAMTRSPMMKKLRDYFATPEDERSDEAREEIREMGKATRERLGVEKLLAAGKSTRKLPRPTEGSVPSNQTTCKPVRSSMPSKLVLHGNAKSPHSQRICRLLDYLDQDFEYREVDLAAGENRTEPFLRLNALGEVPVLEADELIICDSAAIAEYLCTSLPGGNRLLPARSYERARHEMWLALEGGTHKEFTPLLQEVMFASNPDRKPTIDAEHRANLVERIRDKLAILENALSEDAFLTGSELAYCDIAWLSRIRSLQTTRVAEALEEYPATLEWADRVERELGGKMDAQRKANLRLV